MRTKWINPRNDLPGPIRLGAIRPLPWEASERSLPGPQGWIACFSLHGVGRSPARKRPIASPTGQVSVVAEVRSLNRSAPTSLLLDHLSAPAGDLVTKGGWVKSRSVEALDPCMR